MCQLAATTQTPGRVRLHITPFNPDLLNRILAPSIRSEAGNISFHQLQTFAERGFGYVELPAMAAEKLKNKLNGATLKGAKLKIEEAKPEKKRKIDAEGDEEKVERKKSKKAKHEEGVILGHELEEGRHVVRGWVDDVAKKGKKGLEGKKMKFKTVVPPNKAVGKEEKEKEKKKDKKDKKESKGRKESKKTAVVKEFKNTRRPANTAITPKSAAEAVYEEGKGWVNANGEVVEAEPKSAKRKRELEPAPKDKKSTRKSPEPKAKQFEPVVDSDSSSEGSDAESSIVSSGSSEDKSDDAESVVKPAQAEANDSTPQPMGIDEVAIAPTPTVKGVHPLEALFKRPAPGPESASKPKPKPIDTSFNFFNSDGASVSEDNDATDLPRLPQTPHTKQDMEWRGMRSAAPTPETAAFGRHMSFPWASDDVEHDAEDDEEVVAGAVDEADYVADGPIRGVDDKEGGKEESEFRKWFYDHRGDLNRGWKKRRREERKLKRQLENRKISRRIV